VLHHAGPAKGHTTVRSVKDLNDMYMFATVFSFRCASACLFSLVQAGVVLVAHWVVLDMCSSNTALVCDPLDSCDVHLEVTYGILQDKTNEFRSS
jgi:hypothetical protein